MVEVNQHPHSGNSGIIQGVLALGIFATAFYFLFIRKSKSNSDNVKLSNDLPKVDWSEYENRKEFCSPIYGDCVRGFDMPPSINDFNWTDDGIAVIVKPTAPSDLFEGKVKPKHLFKMKKVEDTISGQDEVVGYINNGNLIMDRYEDVRKHLAVVKNTDFKK